MALTVETGARNATIDGLVDYIDTGGGAGYLEFQDAANVTLAKIDFAATAFGAGSVGIATLLGVPLVDASADATGTVTKFVIFLNDATKVLTGTVTATGGGGDIEIDSTTITVGDTITLTAFSLTAPAS